MAEPITTEGEVFAQYSSFEPIRFGENQIEAGSTGGLVGFPFSGAIGKKC